MGSHADPTLNLDLGDTEAENACRCTYVCLSRLARVPRSASLVSVFGQLATVDFQKVLPCLQQSELSELQLNLISTQPQILDCSILVSPNSTPLSDVAIR